MLSTILASYLSYLSILLKILLSRAGFMIPIARKSLVTKLRKYSLLTQNGAICCMSRRQFTKPYHMLYGSRSQSNLIGNIYNQANNFFKAEKQAFTFLKGNFKYNLQKHEKKRF